MKGISEMGQEQTDDESKAPFIKSLVRAVMSTSQNKAEKSVSVPWIVTRPPPPCCCLGLVSSVVTVECSSAAACPGSSPWRIRRRRRRPACRRRNRCPRPPDPPGRTGRRDAGKPTANRRRPVRFGTQKKRERESQRGVRLG